MKQAQPQFWPFGDRAAVLSVPLILAVLFIAVISAKAAFNWPTPGADGLVLTGVLLLSLLPLALNLIDRLAARGGSFEYAGLRIDFAAALQPGTSITIATNIGVPGTPIPDSGSISILETLNTAVTNEIVVVDLADGHAWWETRLLVLAAGATRIGRPRVVVFVGIQQEVPNCFVGWATPDRLLNALLKSNRGYRDSYHGAQAAANQWALVPPGPGGPPPAPTWAQGLASSSAWIAYSGSEPNDLAMEQFLAADLGAKMEPPAAGGITIAHLDYLFRPVLHLESIEQGWSPERRLDAFLASDVAYVALTNKGVYAGLLSRVAGQNAILSTLAGVGATGS